MDYAMPRAGDVPPFAFSTHNVPSTAVDALHRRVELHHIDMPATPRRVWEMLNGIH
jgi:hypothetical protein